jgi:parvulin-like peptidyl-prolyl isomerase
MSVIRIQIIETITADIERSQEHVWIRHILVEDQEIALEVVEKLAEGEDFVGLALEYSTDTVNSNQGGDLGWFSFGMMIPAFEEAAFELAVGEISEPVQTDFGWHILQSLGKEERQIPSSAYDQLRNEAFSNWLLDKRAELEPYVNEDWTSFVPTEPSLPPQYAQYIQALTQPQLVPEATQE